MGSVARKGLDSMDLVMPFQISNLSRNEVPMACLPRVNEIRYVTTKDKTDEDNT